jgi:hypothetical protein
LSRAGTNIVAAVIMAVGKNRIAAKGLTNIATSARHSFRNERRVNPRLTPIANLTSIPLTYLSIGWCKGKLFRRSAMAVIATHDGRR